MNEIIYRSRVVSARYHIARKYGYLSIDLLGNLSWWVLEKLNNGTLCADLAIWGYSPPRNDFGRLILDIIDKSEAWNSPSAPKDLASSGKCFIKAFLQWPSYKDRKINFCYDGSFTGHGNYELYCINDTWMRVKAEKKLILEQRPRALRLAKKWEKVYYSLVHPASSMVSGVMPE